MEPLTFDSTDVELVEDVLTKMYSDINIGAVGPHTRAQLSRRVLGPDVAFDTTDYSFDVSYTAQPPDQVIICDVVSNTVQRAADATNNHTAETFGPGDQFVISRPDLLTAGVAQSCSQRLTVLDSKILIRAAGLADDDAADTPFRVLDHRPVSPQAQAHLQRTIAFVRDEIMTNPAAAQSPLIVASASQLLAVSVLNAYSNTAVATTTPTSEQAAQPTTLARAIAFIENNPDAGLTLTDITRAAYVTPRALQLAFDRHLSTTPMAYLRRVRLDHARDELRAATPGQGQTVTDIAARWGFTSSRFTQHYRAAFGELPSQTLQR